VFTICWVLQGSCRVCGLD